MLPTEYFIESTFFNEKILNLVSIPLLGDSIEGTYIHPDTMDERNKRKLEVLERFWNDWNERPKNTLAGDVVNHMKISALRVREQLDELSLERGVSEKAGDRMEAIFILLGKRV